MMDASQVWAQGSLRIIPPADLLALASRRNVTGRLVLFSASTPRRIVAIHLDRGRPVLAVGTGLHGARTPSEDAYRARQVVLEALGWSVGSFRLEALKTALPEGTSPQDLGAADNLLIAARERSRQWPTLLRRLPGPWDETVIHPSGIRELPADPVAQAVLQLLDQPRPLPELGPRCGVDEHVVLAAVLTLADAGMVRLALAGAVPGLDDPEVARLARMLGMALSPNESSRDIFKITVLSWDSATCFRTVEALLERFRPVPPDIETQPRYQILHETAPLGASQRLEVLSFRSDVFEPTFAAPLVQNCHLFLLVTDTEAGHVWGAERPLVERIQSIREMFSQAAAAGRLTIGAGAVTDPGCDVLIPELGRYVGWDSVSRPGFLAGILRELADRLGLLSEDLPASPAGT